MLMRRLLGGVLTLCALTACQPTAPGTDGEDKEAKVMLQGLWTSEADGSVAFRVEGDTIFYPDTMSQPVKFWIRRDSLYMQGMRVNSYKIKQQSPSLFVVEGYNGEDASWVKSDDKSLLSEFPSYRPYALNFYQQAEADTTVSAPGVVYQCRVTVVPNSDRVIASSYNDYGLEVDNVYLDQTADLSVVERGKGVVLKRKFQKKDFARYVPDSFLSKSILRQLEYDHADAQAVYFNVIIGIPNISTNYVVELKVSREGEISMKLK